MILRTAKLLAFAAVIAALQAQTPPARDGVVSGQVIDAVTGKPVSAAAVSLTGATLPVRPPVIVTGSDGRFVFRGLNTPGSFTIRATKNGYAEGASGRRRPGGSPETITLNDAQKSLDTVIRVWKYGAIGGRVSDEAGEAVIGVRVLALTRSTIFGRPQFVTTDANVTTDDRGAYRFSNLPPADYIVIATPPMISVNSRVFEDIARTGRGAGELAMAVASGGLNNMLGFGDAIVPLGRGSVMPPTARGGRLQIYPPTLHPSATTPSQAAIVTLASGEERSGIDVQLAPVPGSRVSGTIVGPDGPADGMRLQLVPAGADDLPLEMVGPMSMSDSTGGFVFAAVGPGQYTLRVRSQPSTPGSQLYWLEMPVAVTGDDIDGIAAVLAPPLRVTARTQFEGNAERPAPQQPGRFSNLFMLDPADRPSGPTTIAGVLSSDGALTLAGYLPGRYRVRVSNSPPGWMFKSAMLNGVDVSETPFDLSRDVTDLVLTFTDRWSGISGRVDGAGVDGVQILAFTTDTRAWQGAGPNPRRLRSGRANERGEFGISSLPPGEYYVTAIRDEDAGDWRDPAVLDALARTALQITIAEGEHRTLTVPVREVRR